jgi:NADH dehydrogenase [ubiquinone] 1 alpha subcomplex assembly factor 1
MLQIVTFFLLSLTANPMVLFDFSKNSDLNTWFVVNDGVMGGRSQSTFTLNADGNGLSKGKVSLENNGGFASVHCRFKPTDTGNSKTLVIRLKGDGKKYQARIYANTSDSFSYIAYFETSGEWQNIEIPLKSMYPSLRGRKLDKPNFSEKSIEEIAFLIGNKKAESFQLEINKLELK